eukprot:230156_1
MKRSRMSMALLLITLIFQISQSASLPKSSNITFAGMTFTNERYCPNVSMGSDIAYESLKHLKTTGTNFIAIVVTQYMQQHNSSNIFPIYGDPIECCFSSGCMPCKTESTDDLITAIIRSHKLGFRIMLKPHLDLVYDPNYWRGDIGEGFNSSQWNNWFIEYENFILFYANIAEQYNIEILSVSTELNTVSEQESHWRTLMPKIRNIYHGIITDAASGANKSPLSQTEVQQKQWWDLCDIIGVDEYYISKHYSMINGSYPTINQLLNAWQIIENQMLNLTQTWNKPIMFTEIGIGSGVNGSSYSNGKIPPNPPTTNQSLQSQANQYEAAFQAMSKYDWWLGAFWWNWNTDEAFGGYNNTCCEPKYKPAENVIRKWYGATEPPPPPPNYPAQCECWL